MIVSLLIHWLKVDIDVAGVNPSVDPTTTQASQSSCQVSISTYQYAMITSATGDRRWSISDVFCVTTLTLSLLKLISPPGR